jgi:hypothetical protein
VPLVGVDDGAVAVELVVGLAADVPVDRGGPDLDNVDGVPSRARYSRTASACLGPSSATRMYAQPREPVAFGAADAFPASPVKPAQQFVAQLVGTAPPACQALQATFQSPYPSQIGIVGPPVFV